MMNEDFEIDDVWNDHPKKKIKSGRKGKSGERDLVHLLNERFASLLNKHPSWGKFSRSIGSGNRWGQKVVLPEHALNTFTGDLCTPTNFKFVIESKRGYNEIDLCNLFGGCTKDFDAFLKQSEDDSQRCNRHPLLIWKKDRKPHLAFIKANLLKKIKITPRIYYKNWMGLSFTQLLKLEDHFWFNEPQ